MKFIFIIFIIRKVHNEKEPHYSVLKSSYYQLLDFGIKNTVFHLKKIDVTLMTSPKVISMIPSHGSLSEPYNFLFESFFRIYHSF